MSEEGPTRDEGFKRYMRIFGEQYAKHERHTEDVTRFEHAITLLEEYLAKPDAKQDIAREYMDAVEMRYSAAVGSSDFIIDTSLAKRLEDAVKKLLGRSFE